MQILSSASCQVSALARPVYAPGSFRPKAFDLSVEVRVMDRELRAQLAGFDGCERLTLHVPNRDGSWSQVPMAFAGSRSSRQFTFDAHAAHLDNIDLNSVLTQGVAVTMSSNVGDAAFQTWGNNFRVQFVGNSFGR